MEYKPIGFKWKRLSLPSWKETDFIWFLLGHKKEEILKKIFLLILTIKLFATTIYIGSAANLTYALPELIKSFKKKYVNIDIKLIISSSGKLTAQILRGANIDIFLSADMKYPEKIYKAGLAKTAPKVYIKGKIIILSLKHKNISLKDLVNFNTIAISKPLTTPYGKAAIEVFKNAGIYKKIKDKLVFTETVSSVLVYVKNYADVGIISKSAIYSKNVKNLGKFYYKDIDSKLYTPINQGILLLSDKKAAKEFYDFMFTKTAKNILKKYGYSE